VIRFGNVSLWSQPEALTTVAQTAEERTHDRNLLVLHALASSQLSPTERQLLKRATWSILNHSEGWALLVDLGPVGGRGDQAIECWRHPLTEFLQRGPVAQ
jgi:hypothetical protein